MYNEESVITSVLEKVEAEMSFVEEYEIIAVNDGSTDESLNQIKKSKLNNLVIIDHIENLGYGKSLYDGIVKSKYECIAIIDGDGSYPIEDLKVLYQYYPRYDMIVGARTGSEYKKGIFKKPARQMFKTLSEYATGSKIPDVNSGMRIFKKSIVKDFYDALCTGFSFTTTLTLLFFLNHYFVKYIPINYNKRVGDSKVRHFKDTLRAGQIIVQSILYYNPIKLFLLIAILNSGLGVAVAAINYFTIKSYYLDILSAISTASFIPIFILGLIADQLKRIYKVQKGNRCL